jgi:hypothetical protein
MHRRQFISAATGALLFPAGPVHGRQDATVAPEGKAVPAHHGRQRPIVLGDGIELVDYRIYPSDDVPRIIGEISSTRDEMIDAPVVSVVFGDLGASGLAYAPPVLPVMRPGQSNMIFGVLPQEIDTDEKLQQAEFGLCTSALAGRFTELHANLQLRIEVLAQERWETAQRLDGEIHNDGPSPVQWTKVRGFIRDAADRYAGLTRQLDMWGLSPGGVKAFTLWSSTGEQITANAYRLLQGSADYRTELYPDVASHIVSPGCPSIFPWNG